MPESWRSTLAALCTRLDQEAPGFGRWVEPHLMHITLVFLGSQSPTLLEAVIRAIDTAAESQAPFEIEPAGLGVFGSARSVRVIWAGVHDTPPESLAALHHKAERALRAEQIGFDPAEFHPHITLARAQRGSTPDQSARAYKALQTIEAWGPGLATLRCTEIALLRSELRASGPIYTPLHRASLKGT